MRRLFMISLLSISSSVCLGQDAAYGVADSYWPSWAIARGSDMDPVAFEDIMMEGLHVKEYIAELNWKKADQYCRETLGLYSDHMYLGHLEQALAFEMLYRYLLTESLDDQQRMALGFYLDLLLLNNTPDTYTMYRGLQVLKTTWSPERILEAAGQTYVSGEKWLALPSAQIELEEGIPRSRDVATVRIWNMQQSLPKLNELINAK
ncbi:MAG: hypothetical protein AAF564_14245 [Bacteroidota bacterium]